MILVVTGILGGEGRSNIHWCYIYIYTTVDGSEIRLTSWYFANIPLFTEFYDLNQPSTGNDTNVGCQVAGGYTNRWWNAANPFVQVRKHLAAILWSSLGEICFVQCRIWRSGYWGSFGKLKLSEKKQKNQRKKTTNTQRSSIMEVFSIWLFTLIMGSFQEPPTGTGTISAEPFVEAKTLPKQHMVVKTNKSVNP